MTTPLFRLIRWLVLPLTVLLFLQWPLRDAVQAGSREANDLAQILFALYAACAVTAASRAHQHLAAHGSRRFHPGSPAAAWALAVCLVPWAGWLLWSASPAVWQSALALERFPDSNNPGYFLIKIAAWLMAALVLIDALAALATTRRAS